MKSVFVDTSALAAIGNRRGTFHSQAIEIRKKLKRITDKLCNNECDSSRIRECFQSIQSEIYRYTDDWGY